LLPTGTVTLFDGTRNVASATLSDGSATLAATVLGLGEHRLSAYYPGDSLHLPATSRTLPDINSASGPCKPEYPRPRIRLGAQP
jgi:hypothetical protein